MASEFIIVGGNSLCGPYLLRQIADAGYKATIISRRPIAGYDGFTKLRLDLNAEDGWEAPAGSIVLSLLPIWVLASCLPRFLNASAIIATSSTSRFSKTGSVDAHERYIAARLEYGEDLVQNWTEQRGIAWTVLRPTIIYDGVNDQNVTKLANFVRRRKFLPIAWPANGLRQPIHADDVAAAMLKCVNNPACANQAFNISGSEILTYHDMAARIFTAVGLRPRFLKLPLPVLRILFELLGRFGFRKRLGFGMGMFQRMNQDLVFETQTGLAAIGYQPRDFRPEFKDPA